MFRKKEKQDKPSQIYISYSRRDQDIAKRLSQDLTASGTQVWLDVASIRAGERWDRSIQEAMTNSDVLLLLVSPDSMASNNVADEWNYFLDQGKPVIPVLVRPAEMHFRLRRSQYVDATDPTQYQNALQLILQLIHKTAPLQISPAEARVQEQKIDRAFEMVEQERKLEEEPPPLQVAALLAEARKHQQNKAIAKAVEAYTRVLLDRGDPNFRVHAVTALGELRAASGDLIESLYNDPSPEVRKSVVRALAGFQGPSIDEALQIGSVLDTSLEVRVYASLVELYFRQPNRVTFWLDMLASSRDGSLRAVAN